nr:growth-regulating factor 4-like isoform X1 [Coffea arabica]
MSGTSSTSVVTVASAGGGGVGEGVGVGAGGGCYYRPPFTAVQWQELEHQAMIYKYLNAGLPVPPELVVPIRRSFEALSSRFFHHPSLGYCSYYGKKFDPEPGRCRRTDGKKWRCSKDAYPDSKYCERHMHRGRNRSRKPVESHSASQSLSTAMPHMAAGSSSSSGIFQNSGTGSFHNMPMYSVANSEGLYSGSNVTKFQLEPVSYGGDNKEYRYIHGLTPDADQHNFSPEASGSVGSLGVGSDVGNTWRLLPSQVPSSPMLKSKSDAHTLGHSSDLHIAHAFDPMMDARLSKQRQQHCFFGSEIGSPGPGKQEPHSMRPFFDEWPTTKESWSNLDDAGSNKSTFSTTQLSISIPMAHAEFSSKNSRSPDGEEFSSWTKHDLPRL